MTLPPSLLRELENPNLSVNSRAALRCDAAKALEYKGEYEKARRADASAEASTEALK